MNLSELSTEELLKLLDEPQKPDLSKIPTEELLRAVQADPFSTDVDPRMTEQMGPAMRETARKRAPRPGAGMSGVFGAADWLGMGWADEAVAAAAATGDSIFGTKDGAPQTWGEGYDRYKKSYEDSSDAAWEDHPLAYGAGATIGLGASMALPGIRVAATPKAIAAGTKAAARSSLIRSGTATGAAYGAFSGAGQGEGLDRVTGAAVGAGVGAGLGNVVSRGIDRLGGRLAGRASGEAAEQAAYDAAQAEADSLPTPIRLTRGQGTGDVHTQAVENSIRTTAEGGGGTRLAQDAVASQYDALAANLDELNSRLANGAPEASRPQEAAANLAAAVNRTNSRALAASGAEERNARSAANAIETGLGGGQQIVDNEYGLGERVGSEVRSRMAQSAARRDAAYADAAGRDATLSREAIEGMDGRVQENLTGRTDPVIVDETTPNAMKALKIVSDVSEFKAPNNRAQPGGMPNPAEVVGVSPRGIEQVRKRLVALRQRSAEQARSTGNWSDARAMRAIIDEFDGQLEQAVQKGMMSGDDTWLTAYRNARSLHAAHRSTYRPDGEIKRAMKVITDSGTDPVRAANYLYGRARVGDTAIAANLARHLKGIVGEGSEAWQAIKQHHWQRLIGSDGPITHENALRVADKIREATSNRGYALTGQIHSSAEISMMRNFERGLRSMAQSKRTTSEALEAVMDLANGRLSADQLADKIAGGGANKAFGGKSPQVIDSFLTLYGDQSEEANLVRQLVWRKVTSVPEGKNAKGFQQVSSNISDLLDNTVSGRLFSDDIRAQMRRLQSVAKRVAGSADAKNPPNTAAHLRRLFSEQASRVMAGMVAMTSGVDAGASAYLTAKGIQAAGNKIGERKARALFQGKMAPGARTALGLKNRADRIAAGASRRALRAPGQAGRGVPQIGYGNVAAGEDDDE